MDEQVRMYILMRNDLASMTPGRACAQATHAANYCVATLKQEAQTNEALKTLLDEWENQTKQHFGTTIVLGAAEEDLNQLRRKFTMMFYTNLWYGITHDPEYAVADGSFVHLIPLDTCGWLFGRKDEVEPLVRSLQLF